jgi:2-(1,2-epoxy-1,2-dihydrophenyl)acetyl-CoA isomerase
LVDPRSTGAERPFGSDGREAQEKAVAKELARRDRTLSVATVRVHIDGGRPLFALPSPCLHRRRPRPNDPPQEVSKKMTDEPVRYECTGGLARITLARSSRANAVDLATARAFDDAVERAGADPQVRAVLVRGEGPRFCAGGDVAAMVAATDRGQYLEELAGTLDLALQHLAALPVPVVAAVQGAVAGAGLALMLSCDVIVSAASTKFLMAYADVGLTPDCGVSSLLPRAIGQVRALEMALMGRTLTAAEAHEWGLITEVVDDDMLEARMAQIGERLEAGPTYALAQAKRLLRSSWQTPREQLGQEEAQVIADAVTRPEATVLLAPFSKR